MSVFFKDSGQRQALLKDVRRIVIKVGTRLITGVDDSSKRERIGQLVAEIAHLRSCGFEVILVSSGAIGTGINVLGTPKRPRSLSRLQAHAAVGQCHLMYQYMKACLDNHFHCAQVLLTADDVQDHNRHYNIRSCLDALLADKVLPVINENDSVGVEEIRFGDNDNLAALVAAMTRAELTILLTNVNGLREHVDGRLGRRYSLVEALNDETRGMAKDTADAEFSVGGMATKLKAAETVTRAGEYLWIADGRDFSVLRSILAGSDVGTLFMPRHANRMPGKKRYLAFFSDPAGDIWVDAGAAHAVSGHGRSLLPSGITDVKGDFQRGDTIRIVEAETQMVLAKGISNYAAADMQAIKGCKTSEIKTILGSDGCDPAVHRNYMVLIEG